MAPVKLTYPVACILSGVALARAEAIEVPMAIAFTNDNADLIYFGKMEGSLPASSDIAIQKAYTAAALRLSTQTVGRMAQPGEALYGIQHIMASNIVLFGGGLPLLDGKHVIGGVGISGGTVDQDIAVAEAVVDVLDRMVRLHGQLAPLLPKEVKNARLARGFTQSLMAALEPPGGKFLPEWRDVLAGAVLLAAET
jgi:uncharacterized protein GlcG (DUF336 family)